MNIYKNQIEKWKVKSITLYMYTVLLRRIMESFYSDHILQSCDGCISLNGKLKTTLSTMVFKMIPKF